VRRIVDGKGEGDVVDVDGDCRRHGAKQSCQSGGDRRVGADLQHGHDHTAVLGATCALTCDETRAREGGSTWNRRKRTVVSKSRGTDTDESVQPIGPTWSCERHGTHACCRLDRVLPTRWSSTTSSSTSSIHTSTIEQLSSSQSMERTRSGTGSTRDPGIHLGDMWEEPSILVSCSPQEQAGMSCRI